MALRSSSILSAGASAGGTTRRPARRRSAMVGASGSLGGDGRLGRLGLLFGGGWRCHLVAVGQRAHRLWRDSQLHALAAIAALLRYGIGLGFGQRRCLLGDVCAEGPRITRLLERLWQ